MNTFIHVGYPKCFSTTLQRGYFSVHPEIKFGGIGIGSNIDYQNDDLNLIFESAIPYYRNILFKRHFKEFKSSIDIFRESSKKEKGAVCGFSSEHLLFSFTPHGVDADIKMQRIRELLGNQTKVLIILREQFSLIKSLYKEYVRVGYPHSFYDFMDWIYRYQDRNFYHEIMYDEIIRRAQQYFGRESISIFLFEDYKQGKGNLDQSLFDDISLALNIARIPGKMEDYNPSLSDSEIERKRIINSEHRHDLGKTILEGFEDHRRRIFTNALLKLDLPESEIFKDVLIKRASIERAKKIDSKQHPPRYKVRSSTFQRMQSDFLKSNKELERFTGLKILEKFAGPKAETQKSFTLVKDK